VAHLAQGAGRAVEDEDLGAAIRVLRRDDRGFEGDPVAAEVDLEVALSQDGVVGELGDGAGRRGGRREGEREARREQGPDAHGIYTSPLGCQGIVELGLE